jgi:hypothetical protein
VHNRALAKILAVDVLPLPLSPENRYACERRSPSSARDKVWETASCPIKSSNVDGLYLRARAKDKSIPLYFGGVLLYSNFTFNRYNLINYRFRRLYGVERQTPEQECGRSQRQ